MSLAISTTRPALTRLQFLSGCYLLMLLVLLAYGNVYDNEFLYDDDILIVKNHFLRSWQSIPAIFSSSATGGANIPGGFYRPLQILLYLPIYQGFGLSVLPFHILNTGLHAVNAALVFALGIRLNFRPIASFLAAALWALHPVAVEAVTYISATADPLYVLFCLTGVLVALPDYAPRRMALSTICFILALAAKETAITFPLLVSSCIWLTSPRRWHWRSYLPSWPLWLIALLYAAFRLFYMNFDHFVFYTRHDAYADHLSVRFISFLATLPAYVQLLVWPTGLHLDRNFPVHTDPFNPDVLLGGLLVLAALGQIIFGRSRPLSWGLLWCASAHAMHTGILKPLNSLFLEHWLYLPGTGLALGVAESIGTGLTALWQRWLIVTAATLALLAAIALGCATYRQNEVWATSETLYQNIFANGETSAHAYTNLGVVYTKQGQYDKALAQYRLAFQAGHDQDAQPQHDYAITLLMQGNDAAHVDDAIAHFQRALAIDPDFYPAADALASLYEQRGDPANAALYRNLAQAAHAKLAPHSDPMTPTP